MNEALWIDVFSDVDSSIRHMTKGIEIFDQGHLEGADTDSYMRQMAVMHSLQSAYSSVESAIRRIFHMLGEPMPCGPMWHADLLRRASRPGPNRPSLIDDELYDSLDSLRGFRHVAVHNYDNFRPDRARLAVDAARFAATAVRPQFEAFREAIDAA